MKSITSLKIVVNALLLVIGFQVAGLSAQETEKRLAEKQERFAEKLFEDAAQKSKERDYWEGALDLLALLDAHPDFMKFDQAASLLGNTLYELQLFEAADLVNRHLLKSVLKSPYIPAAILGLQKVYYHKGEYQQSLRFYNALESHYASHAEIDEARYYAIQANFQLHNYSFVINTIKHVRRGSDFYPFALYTTALTDLKKKTSDRRSPVLSTSAKPRPKPASCAMWSTRRA